jgi:subfamily B ATP-binding cassette protein MsbA
LQYYDSLSKFAAKTLGKRIGKVTTQQMERAGILNSYLLKFLKIIN